MKIAYSYLLIDGIHNDVDFTLEEEFREFLKEHKKEIDTVTVTLDDGRKYMYERQKGWQEADTPF